MIKLSRLEQADLREKINSENIHCSIVLRVDCMIKDFKMHLCKLFIVIIFLLKCCRHDQKVTIGVDELIADGKLMKVLLGDKNQAEK